MQYRKKPVVIEAFRFNVDPVPEWMSEAFNAGTAWYQGGDEPYITIKTLEGEMRANVGDWIIKGVEGEIYPCSPTVFAKTYRPQARPAETEHARELTGHKVNPANDVLLVEALDGPGPGGASHHYRISGYDGSYDNVTVLEFQNGAINDTGVNGVTHEALIAVLIDRLEGFQAGDFANRFNARALMHLRAAQDALHLRTRERMKRGVEGTHQK